MSTKLIVFAVIIILIFFMIAVYTRVINIDAIIRKREKPLHPASLIVFDLLQQYTYGSNGGSLIIHDKSLRVYSSCEPPVVIRINITQDRKQIFVSDSSDKKILLGSIQDIETKDHLEYYKVRFDVKDKITYRTSFSLIPYYHGFSFFLSSPLFRYYHYYSFYLEKESGASLLLEWKFSTYKGQDGKLVPDLFGDNKEGLVNMVINNKK